MHFRWNILFRSQKWAKLSSLLAHALKNWKCFAEFSVICAKLKKLPDHMVAHLDDLQVSACFEVTWKFVLTVLYWYWRCLLGWKKVWLALLHPQITLTFPMSVYLWVVCPRSPTKWPGCVAQPHSREWRCHTYGVWRSGRECRHVYRVCSCLNIVDISSSEPSESNILSWHP